MSYALEIEGLEKVYANGLQALKGIDLRVAQGDFFALLGPNGAGKTTAIGIITSLVNKTSGEIEVFGHSLDRSLSAAKACLGVVPQELNLNQYDRLDNIVANQFSQAKVEPTALSTISEQTTDEDQPPDPELKVTTKPSNTPPSDDLQKVRSALKEEIASGKVEVSEANGKISVAMTSDRRQGETQGKEGNEQGRRLDDDTVAIYAKVAAAQAQVVSEVQVLQSPTDQQQSYDSGEGAEAAEREQAAQSEYEQIRSRLNTEISNGLVNVERINDEVKISLADQGAFVSGSADLRQSFYSVLTSVGDAISGSLGKVTVAGHTDNVPVAFSERFQSNWDLSAARSASVADYLVGQGYIVPGNVTVTGFADTVPIASNDTAAGRSQNRRIEITVKGGA